MQVLKKMKGKINSFLTNSVVHLICRLIIGGVFIYASTEKVIDPHSFAQAVENYKILPHFLINPFALFLPWFELSCGIFLVLGIFKKSAAILLGSLITVFIFALLFNLLRGFDISCGCFGSGENTLTEALITDLLLLLPCFILILRSRQVKTDKIPCKK